MAEARTPQIAAWCSVLGVDPDADDAVIKAAGKALMTKFHPDLATDEPDRVTREARTKSVSEAVAELLDPRNAPRTRPSPHAGGARTRGTGSGGGAHSGGASSTPPPPPQPGESGYTTPPFGTHYRWDQFSDDELGQIWRNASAQSKATMADYRAQERANRPAGVRTWFAVPAVAVAWVIGMVRWFDQHPAGQPDWWVNGLGVGAAVASVVSATAVGLLRGSRRTSTLAMLGGAFAVAPTTLAVALVAAIAAVLLHQRPRDDGPDWSGAIVVVGAWAILLGLTFVTAGMPLWAGFAPVFAAAVIWPLAASTLGKLPAERRTGARTMGAAGVLMAPAAFPALLIAALVVHVRSRRTAEGSVTTKAPARPCQ